MSFAWPAFLFALLLVPAALLAYWFVQHRRPKYAVRFTNLDLLANVIERAPGWRRHLPPLLYVLALGALVVAIARPQTTEDVPKEEATVILVMDVSGSMRATDVEPTRLDAAKESARSLVDDLPKDFQVALIAFSNNVKTLVPPTKDRETVKKGLDGLLADRGTAMGDAIVQALDLARPPEAPDSVTPGAAPARGRGVTPTPVPKRSANQADRPAVIVLLSDGANSTGFADPVEAAYDAKGRGVPIFTVALGTAQGVVDVTDQAGRVRRIQVPPDEDTLRQIAEITDARFFAAPSASDLKAVYADLGSKIGYDSRETEVGYWFAGAAAVLLMVAGGLSAWWFNRFP
jgi:Ca-activated chloride channel family protein